MTKLTGLSARVIRVWFQNKRCKDKKKAMAAAAGDDVISSSVADSPSDDHIKSMVGIAQDDASFRGDFFSISNHPSVSIGLDTEAIFTGLDERQGFLKFRLPPDRP